jgi:hypothetical protein
MAIPCSGAENAAVAQSDRAKAAVQCRNLLLKPDVTDAIPRYFKSFTPQYSVKAHNSKLLTWPAKNFGI